MEFGEDMTFFEQRVEILMTDIRDALNANAAQTAKLADAMTRIASCVDEEGRMTVIEGKKYQKYD